MARSAVMRVRRARLSIHGPKRLPFGVRPTVTFNGSRTRIRSVPEIRARLNSMTGPISLRHPRQAARGLGGCTAIKEAIFWRLTRMCDSCWRQLSRKILTLRRGADPVPAARLTCGGVRLARTGPNLQTAAGVVGSPSSMGLLRLGPDVHELEADRRAPSPTRRADVSRSATPLR